MESGHVRARDERETREAMGLTRTHYVDLTGHLTGGRQSTAGNQATLAVKLMTDEPIVDQIVALTHVALPYNGVVESYTPLIGVAERRRRQVRLHRSRGRL